MQVTAPSLLFAMSLLAAVPAKSADSVSLCQVLKTPAEYEQKELVITAGYRVGYEWQELICFACPTAERIWVEFRPDVAGNSKLPRVTAFDQLVKVTFRGTFSGAGHRYGHENGYAFQFVVAEVKSAKRVWKLNSRQSEIPTDVKSKVCER